MPPDVTFNLSGTTLLHVSIALSSVMHVCIYVNITVRLFPGFIYHVYVQRAIVYIGHGHRAKYLTLLKICINT